MTSANRTSTALLVLALLIISGLRATAQVIQQDSLALVAFYNALDGPNWTDHSGWLEGPVSTWAGITIDSNRVIQVSLAENGLTGNLPDEIGNLTALQYLYLNRNQLTGELPSSLQSLVYLQSLSLQSNELSGGIPPFLEELDSLKNLDLYGNAFTGEVPNLAGLTALEELLFGNNDLEAAPFPTWLLELDQLRYINFRGMNLTGELPDDLFEHLPALTSFVVGQNNLEGDVGRWFKGTTGLTRFEIDRNMFHGVLQDSVVDVEIGRWAVQHNLLEGIPDFSGATQVKSWFWNDNNKLGFHELVGGLDVQTTNDATRKSLGPQKPLLSDTTIVVEEGGSVTIQAGSTAGTDFYAWYKDDLLLYGLTGSTLVINDFGQSDAGTYHCVIANPMFTFQLERSPVTLQLEGTSAVRDAPVSGLRLFPNPVSDMLHIEGTATFGEVKDLSGKTVVAGFAPVLDVAGLPAGIYILHIQTPYRWRSVQFVKR